MEISLYSDITHFDKPHPKGLRYFVTVDKHGNIAPNSLVAALHRPDKNKVEIGSLTNGLPSNCIEFTIDTQNWTYFGFVAQSFVEDFSYTITWGDGTSNEGNSGEGYAQIEHTFSLDNTNYTARICFSNPSVINYLDFYGFD